MRFKHLLTAMASCGGTGNGNLRANIDDINGAVPWGAPPAIAFTIED